MIFIDYLYYQFANFYKYFEKDGTHKASGIILTCGMLCWNLIFFIIILDNYFIANLGPKNKYFLIMYCLPIISLITLRYWKYTSYEEIDKKIKSFSKNKRIVWDVLLILYVIISLPLFIGFAAYFGGNK
nr:hypothetical protein [uncultured Chryseobacterium sp.]